MAFNLKKFYRKNSKLIITVASGILLILAFIAGELKYTDVSNALWILAAIVGGYEIAKSAITQLRYKVLGIQALVTIAAIGAILIGEYWEAAVVVFLFTFGGYLEALTIDRTRNALRAIMSLTPVTASVRRDGDIVVVPPEEVKPGEVVVIKPGEKIPVDGRVIKGEAQVNQASITGESVPVGKSPGDHVFSGTVNEVGLIDVETERSGEDTTLARIIALVEEAQEQRAPTQQLIERFAKYYTPAIIVLSIIVFLWTRDPLVSLTLLVISCPGALVISTPIAVVSGIGNAAGHGVLIKGGAHLEKAGRMSIVALDKTGTLTKGELEVVNVKAFLGTPEEAIFKAAIAEKMSEHHLGRAILKKVPAGVAIPDPSDFKVLPGKGVIATDGGRKLVVGNRRLLADNQFSLSPEEEAYVRAEEEKGSTAIFLIEDSRLIAVISLADMVREEAKELVAGLKKAGIKKVVMLTGDNERTAKAIATRLGIDEYRAELLPENKVEAIKELKKEGVVAMVGDGINDAPAMAAADIGIAMGAAGTDVAIETADIALMSDSLDRIAYSVGLSRKTLGVIMQNTAFSVLVVLLLVFGVLLKTVVLASGMFIHEASIFIVILNGMRLLRYKG
ncbi:putative heavy metal translocating P-type ATPase [Methanocella paludicola SANAE]|uniref:Heavy metal translocating P-type ATPase n=1 Tax=Methanocella paludicola (strain DSM 17711 / JCM 13418 / NBRC 101707 / SANAE) TaxID=304371 RepID=D1YXF7_METPS|nr:cation-translocating P-type ATPase [Methanocella paludicola]BAI61129.1 putative heavy metal translocating P-type ATPase [Methanocella paludicola SANAE]